MSTLLNISQFQERDCLQLRNERDKKEEQLKSVYSKIEAKDAEVQCRKSKILYVFFLLVYMLKINGCLACYSFQSYAHLENA